MAEQPRVVAAFPGTGKTFAAGRDHRLLDSDSSSFSWEAPGVRHPDWPGNYMRHVQERVMAGDRVLTSTHHEVREALAWLGIPFLLVYPARVLRVEYRSRLLVRGSPEAFVDLVMAQWDAWLEDCEAQEGCVHRVLARGQFLTDVLR